MDDATLITVLETPCREWQGARNEHGYGYLRRAGRQWLTHRWVWTLMNGPIPDGMKILHRCDNPPCFRLDHLWMGTQADNVRDMIAKGRHPNPHRTHCPRGHPYDAANTHVDQRGCRHCRACAHIWYLASRARRFGA